MLNGPPAVVHYYNVLACNHCPAPGFGLSILGSVIYLTYLRLLIHAFVLYAGTYAQTADSAAADSPPVQTQLIEKVCSLYMLVVATL